MAERVYFCPSCMRIFAYEGKEEWIKCKSCGEKAWNTYKTVAKWNELDDEKHEEIIKGIRDFEKRKEEVKKEFNTADSPSSKAKNIERVGFGLGIAGTIAFFLLIYADQSAMGFTALISGIVSCVFCQGFAEVIKQLISLNEKANKILEKQ